MTEAHEINKVELENVSQEIMRFMRGKYELDEVGEDGEVNKISFMHKQVTVLSIYLYDDKYCFEITLNKEDCNAFKQNKEEFSSRTIDLFNKSDLICNEKKFIYSVRNIKELNDIKPLIKFKFEPNRKPFAKENAVYGKCGHRCDLCIHFSNMDEKLRSKIAQNLTHVYNGDDWSMRCSGCGTADCYVKDGECEQLKCAYEKNHESCVKCSFYPCNKATVGYQKLEPRNISADDVTWGILPFVPHQYGN